MEPQSLNVEIICAVCKGTVDYPDQIACPVCGWPVLLYTSKPDSEHISELDKFLSLHRKLFKQQFDQEEELLRITPELEEQRKNSRELNEKLNIMQNKLGKLEQQRRSLSTDPLLMIDMSALQWKADELKEQVKGQREKAQTRKSEDLAPVTLACTYEKTSNEIKAVVTRLWKSIPVKIEPLLGLAFAPYYFDHFSESHMIIPAKIKQTPIKVNDIGQEFRLPLMEKPGEKITHHQIIHLYPHTIPQFIIE